MIAEYSERLWQELETERPKVIEGFRSDMQSLTSKALKSDRLVLRYAEGLIENLLSQT